MSTCSGAHRYLTSMRRYADSLLSRARFLAAPWNFCRDNRSETSWTEIYKQNIQGQTQLISRSYPLSFSFFFFFLPSSSKQSLLRERHLPIIPRRPDLRRFQRQPPAFCSRAQIPGVCQIGVAVPVSLDSGRHHRAIAFFCPPRDKKKIPEFHSSGSHLALVPVRH